jgi:hypothetical protein
VNTTAVSCGGVNSYRPPRGAVEDLVGELLMFHPAQGESRWGCYCISGTSRYSDVARSVECSVFEEFFGNDPVIMTAAYADYERHSMFFLVVDREERRPAGTLRFIKYSERGLKTLNDIAQPPLQITPQQVAEYHGISDLAGCWDCGTLAVLKHYRGRANANVISTMLYGMFHAASRKLGVDHLVTVLDQHAYKQITEFLGVPFVPIAGSAPFDYLGSESSRAAYLRFAELVPGVEARLNGIPVEQRALFEPALARVMYARDIPPVVQVP